MPRFRARDPKVDAIQWTGDNFDDVAAFMGAGPSGGLEISRRMAAADGRLRIITTAGAAAADTGEWIIRDREGTLSTLPPLVFDARYEPDEPPASPS